MGNELEALAVRCEALAGPDREVDVCVFRAIGAPVPFQFANLMVALTYDEAERCYTVPVGDMRCRYEPPAYTASLDDAMSLVPDGCDWLRKDFGTMTIVREGKLEKDWARHTDGKGATPALALCSAALRARALTPRDQGEMR